MRRHAANSKKKDNGFSYAIAHRNGVSGTLSARYYKDGAEILVEQRNKNPRRLTLRECARLLGFPKNFITPVSDNQAYRQFGNAAVPMIVEKITKKIALHLHPKKRIMMKIPQK